MKTPKYPLETYRNFIRDAAPYVSLIVGRKFVPADGERLSDEELERIALLIDARVTDLDKRGPPPGKK